MHMNKVRTTINLNEDVVKKAKRLGINISAVAEMGIINYIKKLENIWSENSNSNDCNSSYESTSGGENSFEMNLEARASALVGVKLTGEVSDFENFNFNISTNVQESCMVSPLFIDFLADGEIEWIAENKSETAC